MGAAESAPLGQAPTVDCKEDTVPVYDPEKAPWWTTSVKEVREPNLAGSGIGACPPSTITAWMQKCAAEKGDKKALAVERPCPPLEGKRAPGPVPLTEWKYWTYKQYYEDCRVAARAFMAMGMEQYDGVNIYGFNSPEWFMGEVSAIMAGGVAAGIYPSDTPEQVMYKSSHSNSSIAVCETKKQADVFLEFSKSGQLPNMKGVVVWDADNEFETYKEGAMTVCHWTKLSEVAKEVTDETLDARIAEQKPGTVAAYIYTSGTTGNPKAVMVTHDNVVYISTAVMAHAGGFGTSGEERVVSYLPLSHVAGMMIDICCPLVVGATMGGYVTSYFARPYDLKANSLVDRLKCVRPTLFLGVPRVWEKIAEKLKELGAQNKGLKAKIGAFGKEKGLAHAKAKQMGGDGKKPWFHGIANAAVLSKISAALGLDQVKLALTGAAPITRETLEYFGMLGIDINECYGMSESTGATTWSSNNAHLWGSCGWAIPGSEIKCFKPAADGGELVECVRAKDLFSPTEEEQGELCFRGRHIMPGYMANPLLGEEHVAEIAKKNAEAIDKHGWMHSGDKGCIDARGMVRVTGRYKELIITAGGENVAPVPIEDSVKALCPMVSNIMMVGDKRKFNSALITLKAKGATGELPGGEELDGAAAKFNPKITTIKQACQSKNYIKAILDAIVATNKTVPSQACKIQKFTILPIDFSVETGELTPTLKLKRAVVDAQHKDLLDRIYESTTDYVPFSDEYATVEGEEEDAKEEAKEEAQEEAKADEKEEATEEAAGEAQEEAKAEAKE